MLFKISFNEDNKMSFKSFNLFDVLKNPLFLGAIVVLLLFGFSFITSPTKENFSSVVFNKIDELCLSGKEAFKIETLSLNLVQENTLKNFSSPFIISPRIYGAISGEEERNEPIEYIVQKGDTLLKVSKKFDISLETILWANNLTKKSKIKLGQRLLILPVSGMIHIVQSGESVGKIAKKYKASTEKIIEFNELPKDSGIFKGDVLIIPDGIMPKEKVYFVSSNITLPSSYFIFPTFGTITKTIWGHGYEAVDIANKCYTTPIVAAASGKVIRAGYRGWRCGNGIDIKHSNKTITRYCHLSKISVNLGDNVLKGQEIGKMGNTGHCTGRTGCHLHFHTIGAKNPLRGYRLGSTISWK